MGDPGVHPDNRPAQLPVCVRGRAHCFGHDEDFPDPVADQEGAVLWGDMYPAADLYRAVGILCRAGGGRDRCKHFLYSVLVHLQKISAGRGKAERYQDIKRQRGICDMAVYGCMNRRNYL